MNSLAVWAIAAPVFALAIPLILTLTALTSPRRAGLASSTVLVLAVLTAVSANLGSGTSQAFAGLDVQLDAIACVMLLLVASLGAVVVRFSRTYLHGDAGLVRYQRWLLLTLAAVTSLVVASNLLIIALGWTATSIALHQLLTFYADRTAALVAAHKKFLVSRLADLCVFASVVLVYRDVGGLELNQIAAWAEARPDLTPAMHIAAVLVVAGVALKSAQLPFHGWLTQVMEAPTPVSALLHAGVVNIGGFVLIRLAPWVSRSEPALWMLVVVGLTSTIIAALVMTTRVSVKVALAWSTCAQMGFMLVQCGLGLWHLALLHIVAHSLYKAHAFLSAGTAVDTWRLRAMTKSTPAPSWSRLATGALVSVAIAAMCVLALRQVVAFSSTDERAMPLLALLVGLSMVPLIARRQAGVAATIGTAVRISGVVLLYAAAHALAGLLMTPQVDTANSLRWAVVGLGMLGLFATKTTLAAYPDGRLARAAYPWLFAGLYLDEMFTRLTFRVWPPRHGRPRASQHAFKLREPFEART